MPLSGEKKTEYNKSYYKTNKQFQHLAKMKDVPLAYICFAIQLMTVPLEKVNTYDYRFGIQPEVLEKAQEIAELLSK